MKLERFLVSSIASLAFLLACLLRPIDGNDSIVDVSIVGNHVGDVREDSDSVYQVTTVVNDDFCDNIEDGSDERNTSACSYFTPSMPVFLCSKDGLTPLYLPASRIQDGICDCCDGRDELQSPFPIQCPNSCEQSLTILRKQALISYRNVQAGSRKKSEMVLANKRKKQQDLKTYETLLDDRREIMRMMARMHFFLTYEEQREHRLRWQLLRERESHCALGYNMSCNYFTSFFVNEDELMYEGYPFAFSAPNKKKRNLNEYSKEELDYLSRIRGMKKVNAMICPKKDLLPDDNSRIFTKLSEYLTFMEAPHGYAALTDRTKLTPKKMKDNSFFAQFLDNGEKGRILGAVFFWEMIGLVMAPITLPIQGIQWISIQAMNSLWKFLEELEMKMDGYLLKKFPEFHQPRSINEGNEEENRGIIMTKNAKELGSLRENDVDGLDLNNEENLKKLFLQQQKELLDEETNDKSNNNNNNQEKSSASSWIKSTRNPFTSRKQTQYFILSSIKFIISNLLDIDRENTWMYQFYHNQLSLENYAFTFFLLNIYSEWMKTPLWIWEIISRAPRMYFDIYWNHFFDDLPPRRNTCLLREGIKTAEIELKQIEKDISSYQQMKELLIQKKLEYLLSREEDGDEEGRGRGGGGDDFSNRRKRKVSKKKNLNGNPWELVWDFLSSSRLFTFFSSSSSSPSSSQLDVHRKNLAKLKSVHEESPLMTSIKQILIYLTSFVTSSPSSIRFSYAPKPSDLLPTTPTTSSSSSSWSLSLATTSSQEEYFQQLQRLYIDYGPQQEWESVENLCISKQFHSYNYSFCFFQEIKQDSMNSLGKFQHWGSNFFDIEHQQYSAFYPLIMKYRQLYQQQGTDQQQQQPVKDIQKDFQITTLMNIYEFIDEIQGNSHSFMNNFYYQQFHAYFLNNSYFQQLSEIFLTTEEKQSLIQFFQPYLSFLQGQSNRKNNLNDLQEEISQIPVQIRLKQFYQNFLPFTSIATIPTLSSEQRALQEERERLLKEHLHVYYSQQVYEHGTECQVKPGVYRRTIVFFDCGSENTITEVKEYEVCQYEMRVVTPLACNGFLEEMALKYLEELGVFGFSKKP